MIKAVLFDLDGTLLNRDLSIQKFIHSQYDRLIRFMEHIPKESFVARFLDLDDNGYVWKDKVYQLLVNEFHIQSLTWEELLDDYTTHFSEHCVAFLNLNRMLEDLESNNIILGMITNGKGQFQMDNIEALGIRKYFHTILISESEGLKKPDPRIFKKALKNLGVSAQETLFVGDHPVNDVGAAQKIGMQAVWKLNKHWDGRGADYIIDDLSEMILIIEKLNKKVEANGNGIA